MIRSTRLEKFLPWRSAWLGGAVAAVFLLLGLPIFLRMPPWADLTLYDVAAANLLRGGVHYKDVFDTNLPGFVWLLTLIRGTLGWSYEAIRFVDLAIVCSILAVLDRFARDGGATKAVRLWTLASLAAFYPFLTEACHAQRDVWMLLPALLAVRMRWKMTLPSPGLTIPGIFSSSLCQGMLWAAAVWIKPHVVVPAVVVWLGTLFFVQQGRGWRCYVADVVGNVLGGAILGILGIAYLWFSGAWDSFVEVFTYWNPSYADRVFSLSGVRTRLRSQDAYFPPWSYLHWVALPLAFFTILDGVTGWVSRKASPYIWNAAASRMQSLARLFPAVLYLGWTLQAIGVQREFHYVHVAEIFLILTLLGMQRWAVAFLGLFVILVVSILVALGWFDNKADSWPGVMVGHDPIVAGRHPITHVDVWQKWVSCWRFNLTDEEYRARMWSLSRVNGLDAAPNWVELGEVAEELQRRGVKDGDLITWNDSPHALYLMLRIRPGFRYMHVRTFQTIGPEHDKRIFDEAEIAAKNAKYAVSDLQCLWTYAHVPYPDSEHDDSHVVILPKPGLDFGGTGIWFPFDRPAVFRSGGGAGRYLIHDLREKK